MIEIFKIAGVIILALLTIITINFSEKLRVRGLNRGDSFLLACPIYLIIIVVCLFQFNPQNNTTTIQIVLASLALLCLIPQVRKLIAYLLPIDPQNRIHTAALSISMFIFVNLSLNTDINKGLRDAISAAQNRGDMYFLETWLFVLFSIMIGFLGVGLFVRRNWRESCQRLGLVRPRINQLWFGVLLAIGEFALWIIVEHILSAAGFSSDPETAQLSKEYTALFNKSICSILTIGFAAGISEEIICRGALLPRLGIIYSSLIFAAAHTQYGISFSLLSVFIGGFIYALVRRRYNTNTAIIMHATHNILIAILPFLYEC